MAPPGIPGYTASFNPYPSGADNTGDDVKAKQELAACGKPNGFSTKLAYATPGTHAAAAFAVEQAALAKVGIQVTACYPGQLVVLQHLDRLAAEHQEPGHRHCLCRLGC